jgi:Transposase, Mutator family
MVCAKKCNLKHRGVPMSKYSGDGKRKRKQRIKGFLKDTVEQVSMVKTDNPVPKEVIKAAANVSGEMVTYNQSYHAIKADEETNYHSANYSYNWLIHYLNEFKKLNPGAEVDYKELQGKFEGLFICPHFMNHSLQFVRPVIACPLIATNHPLEAHKRHGYFTFVSDRDKGLVQALKDVFPTNHTTQCSIHIQQNVAAKFSNKVAADICNISKTFSVYQENKMLSRRNLLMIIW